MKTSKIVLAFLISLLILVPFVYSTTTVSTTNIVLNDQINPTLNVTSCYIGTLNGSTNYVQVYRMLVENGTSFPVVASSGYLFFNTASNTLAFYNGTAWTNCTTESDSSVYLLSASASNFLFQNGTRALTADWNVGSYGIYGVTALNTTALYCSTIDALTSTTGVQVLKLIVENGTSFPASPVDREFFFRSDEGYLYVRNNSVWKQIGTTLYSNLTGTPDLTVYLTKDGATALTGNWNAGGSYGIYGFTWVNSTSINADNYYLNDQTLGFVQPATFIIDYNATSGNYQAWHGSNSTLFTSSTNASAVINNAIGNLTSGRTSKERVYLKGNFSFDSSQILLPSYTILQIDGKLTLAAGFSKTAFILNSNGAGALQSDIEVVGGEIDGNGANTNQGDIIYFRNVTRVRIANIYIHDSNQMGVRLGYGSTTPVTDSLVENVIVNKTYNVTSGFACFDGYMQRVKLVNCHASFAVSSGFNCWGSDISYLNCWSYNNSGAGFYCDTTISYVNFVDCQSFWNNQSGLTSYAGKYVTVLGGTYYQNNLSGLRFQTASTNGLISSVKIYDNGKAGTAGDQYGIYLTSSGTTDFTITGCDIYDSQTSCTQRRGIFIDAGCMNTTITSNRIHGSDYDGIKIQGYSNYTIVSSNQIYDNADGVDLWNAYNIFITDNMFTSVPTPIRITTSGSYKINNNVGFVTENSGSTASCINGTWIATGLAGQENGAVTLKVNGTRLINATCYVLDPTIIAENSTHVQIEFLYDNAGTFAAVTATETKTILWYFEYKP